MFKSSETLIVLGKGFVKDKTKSPGGVKLSIESRITALAAATLFKDRVVSHLIFCGGHTAGKENLSEAAAMQEIAVLHGGIPYDQCILEDTSIDTHQNAENLMHIVEKRKEIELNGIFPLLTLSFHLPRAITVFRRHGFVSPRGYASDVVLSRLPALSSENDLVTRYHASTQFKVERAKEVLGRVIQYFDPDGVNLRKIVRMIRHGG